MSQGRYCLCVTVSTRASKCFYACICTCRLFRNIFGIFMLMLFRKLCNALCITAVTSGAGVGSDAFLCCRWLLCHGCFIVMSQCCQFFSHSQKFVAIRTIGISSVAGLCAGCFLLVLHGCMHMVTCIHFTKSFATNTAHSFRYTCSRRFDRVRFFLEKNSQA